MSYISAMMYRDYEFNQSTSSANFAICNLHIVYACSCEAPAITSVIRIVRVVVGLIALQT